MLRNLAVRDFFLFRSVDLDFFEGLTIVLGETGSGKSLLFECIKICLGFKNFQSDFIRRGAESCSISLEFEVVSNEEIIKKLNDKCIEIDGNLVIRRIFKESGVNKIYLNDEVITTSFLKELSPLLLDFNSQGDQFKAINKRNYVDILDKYCSAEKKLNELKSVYSEYKLVKEKLDKLKSREQDRLKEIEFLEYSVSEISNLNPRIGEEEDLESARREYMNYEKKLSVVQSCLNILAGGQDTLGAGIQNIIKELTRNARLFDEEKIENQISHLENIYDQIEQLENNLKKNLNYDDNLNIDELQDRLFSIKEIARKHRCTADELTEKLASFKDELVILKQDNEDFDLYNQLFRELESKYFDISNDLYVLRNTGSKQLQERVKFYLDELGMPEARFLIDIQHDPSKISINGSDDINFLGSMNPGTDLSSIDKVASGGELSRFLLALKVAIADKLSVKTVFFDEIDTGVSGSVAFSIADQIKDLSKNNQVLIITHSPQVTSVGERFIKVVKNITVTEATSEVRYLGKSECEEEITKLLSGRNVTEKARSLAREYLGD